MFSGSLYVRLLRAAHSALLSAQGAFALAEAQKEGGPAAPAMSSALAVVVAAATRHWNEHLIAQANKRQRDFRDRDSQTCTSD